MEIKNHDTLRQWMERVYQRTGFWPTFIDVFDYAREELKPLKQRVAELEKDCEILQTNLDAALMQVKQLREALNDALRYKRADEKLVDIINGVGQQQQKPKHGRQA